MLSLTDLLTFSPICSRLPQKEYSELMTDFANQAAHITKCIGATICAFAIRGPQDFPDGREEVESFALRYDPVSDTVCHFFTFDEVYG